MNSPAPAALESTSHSLPANSSARADAARRNVLAGLLFIVTACLLLFVLIPYGVDAPRKVKFAALHPAYYPRLVALSLLLLGVAVLLTGLAKVRKVRVGKTFRNADASISRHDLSTDTPTDTDQRTEVERSTRMHFQKLLPLGGILLFVFFSLPPLGFPLTTCIALLLLLPLAGERRWWLILTIALLLPALLYLFFTQVANIPIPGGVLDPVLLKI